MNNAAVHRFLRRVTVRIPEKNVVHQAKVKRSLGARSTLELLQLEIVDAKISGLPYIIQATEDFISAPVPYKTDLVVTGGDKASIYSDFWLVTEVIENGYRVVMTPALKLRRQPDQKIKQRLIETKSIRFPTINECLIYVALGCERPLDLEQYMLSYESDWIGMIMDSNLTRIEDVSRKVENRLRHSMEKIGLIYSDMLQVIKFVTDTTASICGISAGQKDAN